MTQPPRSLPHPSAGRKPWAPPRPAPRCARLGAGGWLGLLLALLLAQGLGLWHRSVHGATGAGAEVHQAADSTRAEAPHSLGHTAGDAACRLLDELLLGAVLLSAAALLLPARGPAAWQGVALATPWCAGPLWAYQARAPPQRA